jgi:hypothetical protein
MRDEDWGDVCNGGQDQSSCASNSMDPINRRRAALKSCAQPGPGLTSASGEGDSLVRQVHRRGGPSKSMCVALVDVSRFSECRAKAGDFVVLQ